MAKKKFKFHTLLVNLIIDLERTLEKIFKKEKYIAINGHNTP